MTKYVILIVLCIVNACNLAFSQEYSSCPDRQINNSELVSENIFKSKIPTESYNEIIEIIDEFLLENASDCILVGDALLEKLLVYANAEKVDELFDSSRVLLDHVYWNEDRNKQTRSTIISLVINSALLEDRHGDAVDLFESEMEIFYDKDINKGRVLVYAYAKLGLISQSLALTENLIEKNNYFSHPEIRPEKFTDAWYEASKQAPSRLSFLADVLAATGQYTKAKTWLYPSVERVEIANSTLSVLWMYALAMEETSETDKSVELARPIFNDIVRISEAGYMSPEILMLAHASMARIYSKADAADLENEIEKKAKRSFGRSYETNAILAKRESEIQEWFHRSELNPNNTPNDKQAELIKRIKPYWPPQVPANETAKCYVMFSISKRGRATNINAECSDDRFQSSAISAVEKTRWKPRLIDGKRSMTYFVGLPLEYRA